MSVLSCDRLGCENIMCDRLSGEHGYICGDCFAELTTSHIRDIVLFMATIKRETTDDSEFWYASCDNTFKMRE